ncbi:hypothetical protein R5H56_002257 [Enterococcus faecium]|nr:hypothetical protein [Enterococcus faecium]
MAERKGKKRNDSVNMWTIVLGTTVKKQACIYKPAFGTFKASIKASM